MSFLDPMLLKAGHLACCKNFVWLKFNYHPLASLALIAVCSIYIGQLLQASAAPLIIHMHKHLRGVANVW